MKEMVTDEIVKLQKEADKLWDDYFELTSKIREMKMSSMSLDYEGKIIKYKDDFEGTYYMIVESVMRDGLRYTNEDFSFMFCGLGFLGEFTGYEDATVFNWNYWLTFYIHGDEKEFTQSVNNIKEITLEEFNGEFEKQLERLKEYHYRNIGQC